MLESIKLVKGPAREIFPRLSRLPLPAIITAPGETILKKGESMEIRVNRAPMVVNRNSAQSPKCWAVILWASSCSKKDEVKITARLIRTNGEAMRIDQNRDMPTPMTSRAPRARCLSSVRLNQKTVVLGLVSMGRTYSSKILSVGLSKTIGAGSLRGIFVFQYSGHSWFSGSRC